MFTTKREGNVFFLIEWRLCCQCCRMINRNFESHIVGVKNNMVLFQHLVCPPNKGFKNEVHLLRGPQSP